jgi:hypothetical protein
MRKLIAMLTLLLIAGKTVQAQTNKLCGDVMAINLTNAYVFSERTEFNYMDIFGERINMALVNVILVKTPEQKAVIDKECKEGKLAGNVFIFPDDDPAKTRRFCTDRDYAAAMQSADLKIQLAK